MNDNAFNFSLNHKINRIEKLLKLNKIDEARNLFKSHVKTRFSESPSIPRILKLISYSRLYSNELFNRFKLEFDVIELGTISISNSRATVYYVPEKSDFIAEVEFINKVDGIYHFIMRIGHDDPGSYMHEISHLINDPNNMELIQDHIRNNKSLHDTPIGRIYEARMDINSVSLARDLLNYNLSLEDRLGYLVNQYLMVDNDLRLDEPERYNILMDEIIRRKKSLGEITKGNSRDEVKLKS